MEKAESVFEIINLSKLRNQDAVNRIIKALESVIADMRGGEEWVINLPELRAFIIKNLQSQQKQGQEVPDTQENGGEVPSELELWIATKAGSHAALWAVLQQGLKGKGLSVDNVLAVGRIKFGSMESQEPHLELFQPKQRIGGVLVQTAIFVDGGESLGQKGNTLPSSFVKLISKALPSAVQSGTE